QLPIRVVAALALIPLGRRESRKRIVSDVAGRHPCSQPFFVGCPNGRRLRSASPRSVPQCAHTLARRKFSPDDRCEDSLFLPRQPSFGTTTIPKNCPLIGFGGKLTLLCLATEDPMASAVDDADKSKHRARRLIEFLLRELREIWPPTLFFFIGFNLIVFTKRLILEQFLIQYSGFLIATTGALIVGKAVLVVDAMPFLRYFDRRPLAYPILFKAVVY